MARGQKKGYTHLHVVAERPSKPVRVERGIWLHVSGRYGVLTYHKKKQAFRMVDTLSEARELRDSIKRATRRGLKLVSRATQKQPLNEFFTATYVPDVMRGGGLKESTIRAAESRMRQHVVPFFRDTEIGALTFDDCLAFRTELMEREDLSGQTRRECLMLVRQMLEHAVLKGVILANPAALVKLPPKNSQAVDVPEYDDALKVIAELRHPVARMVGDLLLRSGMRLNEALALEWPSVNLKDATILVKQSIDQVEGAIVPTKTNRVRTIDIPPSLVTRLKDYRAAQEEEKVHRHDPWVLPAESATDEGRPFNDRNFQQRHWDPAVERAGVTRFTPHGLRHLFASHLLQRGAEISYVSKQLGHASIYTTHNYYSHYLPRSSSARRQLADTFAD